MNTNELKMIGWINTRGMTTICMMTDGLLYYVVSYCWGKESISRGYTTLETCEVASDKMNMECN